MVSRHGNPDCSVLVKPSVHLHEEENPLLQLVKHGDLNCIEEVGHGEVAHHTWNISKNMHSSVEMAQPEFGNGCLGVGIAEHSTQILILPGVLFVRIHMISKFVLWTLTPKTDMLLEMM